MKHAGMILFCCSALLHPLDLSRLEPADTVPLIPYGFGFPEATWNDPCLLDQGDSLIMYASASKGFATIRVCIYRLVSTDGTNWHLSPDTAVFSPSTDSTAWDYGGTETPSVVFFNGQYHLYVTAYNSIDSVLQYKTGHAVSPDGIRWTRTPAPVLVPTGRPTDFNAYFTAEPGALVYHNELLLYFTTMGYDTTLGFTQQTIGLARSTDGVNFSSPIQVVKPDQTRYPRAKGWLGFSTPCPVVISDTVHLFTSVVNDSTRWMQYAIHHFESPDGETRFLADSAPLYQRQDFSWTHNDILAPAPVIFKDRFLLYFSGNDLKAPDWNTAFWGIGLVSFPLLSTRIKQQAPSRTLPLFTLQGNPFQKQLVVNIRSPDLPLLFSLYDITGRHCMVPTLTGIPRFQIPTSELSPGPYFLKVESGKKTTVCKVIKTE